MQESRCSGGDGLASLHEAGDSFERAAKGGRDFEAASNPRWEKLLGIGIGVASVEKDDGGPVVAVTDGTSDSLIDSAKGKVGVCAAVSPGGQERDYETHRGSCQHQQRRRRRVLCPAR